MSGGRARTSETWEQVWRGDGEGQAAIVAGGLESRGIDTRTQGTPPMPQAYPTAWARNNWVVFVPGDDAAPAREYLRETGEAVNVVDAPVSTAGDQLFMLKVAGATILGVAIASVIGVLFFDWRV